jgi:hypothetical protein
VSRALVLHTRHCGELVITDDERLAAELRREGRRVLPRRLVDALGMVDAVFPGSEVVEISRKSGRAKKST